MRQKEWPRVDRSVFVGIPVHNHFDAVDKCIAAVNDACYYAGVDYMICLVDDNSDSETLAGLIALNNQYFAHMMLLHTRLRTDQPSPNLGLAVNMALEAYQHSNADYYWNVETDVFPTWECLEKLIDTLDRHPEVGMACPLFVDPEKTHVRHCFPGAEGQALAGQPLDNPDAMKALLTERYVTWQHMGCNLVPGEIAKDPRCRVDESFRLWCCDFDWAWCVEDIFKKKLLYAGYAQAVHVGSVSSSGTDRPSFEDEREANIRVRQKWNRMHL